MAPHDGGEAAAAATHGLAARPVAPPATAAARLRTASAASRRGLGRAGRAVRRTQARVRPIARPAIASTARNAGPRPPRSRGLRRSCGCPSRRPAVGAGEAASIAGQDDERQPTKTSDASPDQERRRDPAPGRRAGAEIRIASAGSSVLRTSGRPRPGPSAPGRPGRGRDPRAMACSTLETSLRRRPGRQIVGQVVGDAVAKIPDPNALARITTSPSVTDRRRPRWRRGLPGSRTGRLVGDLEIAPPPSSRPGFGCAGGRAGDGPRPRTPPRCRSGRRSERRGRAPPGRARSPGHADRGAAVRRRPTRWRGPSEPRSRGRPRDSAGDDGQEGRPRPG
jgi:hypothetical protein